MPTALTAVSSPGVIVCYTISTLRSRITVQERFECATMKASGITAIFTFLLKIITLLGFLIGLGFIIFGCILETPPKTAIPA